MNDALQQHAFTKAVEICLALREDMSADDLQDVLILKKLHNRVKTFSTRTSHQFDKSLRKVASEFDPRGTGNCCKHTSLSQSIPRLWASSSQNSSLHEVLSKIPEVVVRCIDDLTRQFIASCFGERLSPKKPKGKAQKKHSSTHESNQRELAVSSSGTEQAVENVRRVTMSWRCWSGSIHQVVSSWKHMISLSQATSVFIEVGEEFTGSPSTRMRSLLRLKCEQYITSFHDDNLELLRMLIDTERWQRIFTEASIVDVTNEDILRLVEKRSGYRLNQAKNTQSARYRSHINAIHERGVFTNFHVSGNPFSALASSTKTKNWETPTAISKTNSWRFAPPM
ncbi:hypothetical protein PINS_up020779 [Pythium insidiosum]|nr:hypothetical protein PINS_up020779 [Pythium insidiosum]